MLLNGLNIVKKPLIPFEIMCDASDYVMDVVLGQRKDKKPYKIY